MAAVLVCAVLGLSGCAGGDAGASTPAGKADAAPGAPSAPAAGTSPKSALAALIVVPKDYGADPREVSGPFGLQAFLDSMSSVPPEDRALLLNASFKDGYQAARLSPDKRKQYVVQLFRTGSPAKAKTLQLGFWQQDTHAAKFAVPGVPQVFSDKRVTVTGTVNESEAIAEVSFVVGSMLAQITVRQTGHVSDAPVPDTALAASIARQQYTRLTTKNNS